MGHCYQAEPLGMLRAALRCHRRALPHDREGVAVHELVRLGSLSSSLSRTHARASTHARVRARTHTQPSPTPRAQAKLHAALGERPQAAHYHRLNLARCDVEGGAGGSDALEALAFLAEYHKVGGWYCMRVPWEGTLGGHYSWDCRVPQGYCSV
jgi:hypothetical protein